MWSSLKQSRVLWTVLFIFVALIWGVAFVVVKDSTASVTPLYMLAFRFCISFAAGALFCLKLKCTLDRDVLKKGICLGTALFVAYVLQTYGIKYTTAGKNAFITTFYIVLVPFLNFLFYRKKVTGIQIFGAFLALFGVGLLTLGGDGGINIGDVLTFGCSIAFAVQIVMTGRFAGQADTFLLNTIQLGTAAVLSVITAPIVEGPMSAAVSFSAALLGSMLYLGILSTFFAECVQTIGLKYINPLLATILMSLESVFGVLASVLLLGERLTGRMILGCIMMFAAVIIVELQEK